MTNETANLRRPTGPDYPSHLPRSSDGWPSRQFYAWIAAIALFAAVSVGGYFALKSSDGASSKGSEPHPAAASPDQPMLRPSDTVSRPTLTADELFARSSPAVVQVVIQDRRGRTIGAGSGFLVGEHDLIATNYHVIEDASTVHVALTDSTKVSVLGVVGFDKDTDIALLKLSRPIDANPLELAGDNLPPVGTKVYAIGNPRGLSNTLSDGLVSGHRENDEIGLTEIQTSAPISPGSSGGPLLTADGRVVGVTTSQLRNGQNLNFAVPASEVAFRLLLSNSDQILSGGERKLTRFPLVREPDALRYVKSGNAWLDQKEYDKALKDYDEAIRIAPSWAKGYYFRGTAWYKIGNNDGAIKDLDEAIRLDPKLAEAYRNRGRTWLHKYNYDRAIEDLDEAIRLNRNDWEAHHACGNAWKEKKEFDKAIRDLDEAIRLNPKVASAFLDRAESWAKKKEYDRAIRDYEEAILLNPEGAFTHWQFARLLATCPDERGRDGKRAVQMATKACELSNWKDSFYFDILAAAYAETGQFDEAVRYQSKALESPTLQKSAVCRQRLELYKQKKPDRREP